MIRSKLALFAASMIFALGLVMIFNTTSAELLDTQSSGNTHLPLIKQMLFGIAGLLGARLLYQGGVERFIRLSPLLTFVVTALLLLCFFPGIGRAVNGSHRWITLGGFSFQPSEFVKIILPAYLICRLQSMDLEAMTLREFATACAPLLIPLGLILMEPNNGTVGVIVLTLAVVCLLMGVRLKFWALPLAIVTALMVTAAVSLPYVRGRIHVYLHPELDLLGRGHQPYQAKIAAGSGGVWGVGPGRSLQKMSYLPEAQNDYIAAIFAEEFGYVGITFLIALYGALIAALLVAAQQRREMFAAAYCGAIAFLIGFQAFMNLGVVSGLLPSTGLNLPFFSQGGTSLIANICALGLLLSRVPVRSSKYESIDRSWGDRGAYLPRGSGGVHATKFGGRNSLRRRGT